MTIDHEKIVRDTDDLAPLLQALATKIHAHPELRFQEHRAAEWLTEALEQSGAAVERSIGGMSTAFRARIGNGR